MFSLKDALFEDKFTKFKISIYISKSGKKKITLLFEKKKVTGDFKKSIKDFCYCF